jgi:hypothetical protein
MRPQEESAKFFLTTYYVCSQSPSWFQNGTGWGGKAKPQIQDLS